MPLSFNTQISLPSNISNNVAMARPASKTEEIRLQDSVDWLKGASFAAQRNVSPGRGSSQNIIPSEKAESEISSAPRDVPQYAPAAGAPPPSELPVPHVQVPVLRDPRDRTVK